MAISASPTTSTDPAPRGGSDYSQLMARVRAEGLLERSVRNYLLRFAVLAVLMAGGLVLLVTVGSSWWQLAVAAYWAVVFAQLGFLGHDAGHQQIFPSRRRNDRLGLWLSNLVIGLSYSWWIDKHNRHHRHPNDVERDPDVARNVIAWTPAQARLQRGALKFVARHQAALFFPFLVFEAINLHVGSVRSLLAQPRRQWTELAAAHGPRDDRRRGAAQRDVAAGRPWRSWPCTRRCSGSTSAAASRPTTRGCRCSRRQRRGTSCVGRC